MVIKKSNIYNLPNFLSLYRLLMFPYILYLGISRQESLFAILLSINLITDVLDGLIARCFNMQTEFGILYSQSTGKQITGIALGVSVVVSVVELISPNGSDNLTIPLSVIGSFMLFDKIL